MHSEFRTVVEVAGVTVTGVLPGTAWRPEGGVQICGDVQHLGRDQARDLAYALHVVATRMDSVADERYGSTVGPAGCGEG